MSFNGSGTFQINTAGQPVVTGTVISSTAFNALTADLATGLSTCITKDGQTTPSANIPMGGFKITNLANGTNATDAVNFSQLQSSAAKYLTVSGTDTITAGLTPALTVYTTGDTFSFVVANTNTTAVTINIDSLGAKAITRDGTTALAAGDLVAGEVVMIVYDGTRFQVINPNAFTNLKVSGTLGVTGAATLSSTLGVTGATTLSNTLGVTGAATLSNTLSVSGATTLSSTVAITSATTIGDTLTVAGVVSSGATFNDVYGKVRAIPQSGSDKTTSYTLATTDVGRFVGVGTGGSITIPNSTFSTGDVVSVFNNTTGNITITCSITNAYITGVNTSKASMTLATRGVATILFISGTTCVVSGSVT